VEPTAIETAYRVLGVPPDSSALRIKREYRRLARLWHPDKFAHDPREQRRATERMREINAAYELVKHAPLRYRSDARSRTAALGARPVARRTAPLADTIEYVVRFVAGFAFGLVVAFLLSVGDISVALIVIVPLLTGTASVVAPSAAGSSSITSCRMPSAGKPLSTASR
jgi:hypothetical protein